MYFKKKKKKKIFSPGKFSLLSFLLCLNQSVPGPLLNFEDSHFSCSQADILDENKRLISAVDYYFILEDGSRFKVGAVVHAPHCSGF